MTKLHYEKYGDRWRWTIGDEEDRYFTTNSEGEGIFEVSFYTPCGDRRQLTGTLQFSVKGLSDGWAKRKIRRWMVETGRLDEDDW